MIKPEEHEREEERIQELNSYAILDTLSEKEYDDLTAIASEICDTPIALVSLIDEKRQWFKSHHGLDATSTPREYAFCAHAINDPENVFVVQDSREDERFHDNPLVRDAPDVIFYAGVPLIGEKGLPLGTLCVIDHKPKQLNENQLKSLKALSKQVMNLLTLRKKNMQLQKALERLDEKNVELERFAYVAAHDIKSPLNNISRLSKLFQSIHEGQLSEQGIQILDLIEHSSQKLKNLVDGLLEYSRSEKVLKEMHVEIDLEELKNEICGLFSYDNTCKITLNTELKTITTNRTALDQILINLVANAMKYNDKDCVEINLEVRKLKNHYEFVVKDNGPGIAPENQDKIFNIFEIATAKDKFGRTGNGIGLATVKRVVQALNGEISLKSELGNGATFTFTIER